MTRLHIIAASVLALWLFAVATLAADAPQDERWSIVGPPRGTPLAGDQLKAKTQEVAALLRCPVCQGASVADSPASMAVKMKAEASEMLAAGYDREQVLAYFERSYGEFVRLEPPLRGVNWLVWLGPGLGLVGGVAIVAWVLRRRGRGAGAVAGEVPGRDTLPDDAELARWVLAVRERAYGWPQGKAPRSERTS